MGLLLSYILVLAAHAVLIRPGNVSQQHWPTAHFLYHHLQTFSPAPMTDFMAFLSAEPLMPSWVYAPPSKQLAKHLHPAWMGMQNTFLLPLALIYQFWLYKTPHVAAYVSCNCISSQNGNIFFFLSKCYHRMFRMHVLHHTVPHIKQLTL